MTEIDFNKSPEDLLKDKISYHRQQARFHVKMAEETKKKLQLLTGVPATNDNQGESSGIKLLDGMEALDFYKTQNYSVTVWKPLVEKVLWESNNPLKTEEILIKIDPRYTNNETMRKKAIGAISSSLYSLVENNKAIRHEAEGRGHAYSYNILG